MSTAVIYTGQARSFAKTFWNHNWHLLSKLDDPHIYVSVADDADAPAMDQLRDLGYPVVIERITQPDIIEPAEKPGMLGIYPPSSPAQAILRQFWHLTGGWEMMRESKRRHDVVVRVRPDLVFGRLEIPSLVEPLDCYTPWWARWGGVNDRFAIMGHRAADTYFTAYDSLPKYLSQGCPLHPETLLAARLQAGGVDSRTLNAEFVTLRTDGTVVPMSITSMDLYLR